MRGVAAVAFPPSGKAPNPPNDGDDGGRAQQPRRDAEHGARREHAREDGREEETAAPHGQRDREHADDAGRVRWRVESVTSTAWLAARRLPGGGDAFKANPPLEAFSASSCTFLGS